MTGEPVLVLRPVPSFRLLLLRHAHAQKREERFVLKLGSGELFTVVVSSELYARRVLVDEKGKEEASGAELVNHLRLIARRRAYGFTRRSKKVFRFSLVLANESEGKETEFGCVTTRVEFARDVFREEYTPLLYASSRIVEERKGAYVPTNDERFVYLLGGSTYEAKKSEQQGTPGAGPEARRDSSDERKGVREGEASARSNKPPPPGGARAL